MTDLSESLQTRFGNLACRLSPENLSCDGEASAEHVRQETVAINKEWAYLEAEAGRKVTLSEVETALYRR